MTKLELGENTERLTVKDNGFEGMYIPGTISPDKVIIATGGSFCNEEVSLLMCRYIRKAGYTVLLLGYYMWEGLQKDLVSIPVDFAEKAVKWLKEVKKPKGIAITGASTGAAYSLLAASLIPDINCVVAIVPYDYVPEGTTKRGLHFKVTNKSQYTWHGEDLPFMPFEVLKNGMLHWYKLMKKTPGYNLRRASRFGYDEMEKNLKPEARIKVENMHAEVLVLGVKDDDAWPSDVAVPRIVRILKEANYPYRVESHVYEKASHALMDGIDEMKGYPKWALKNKYAEKKYPKECEKARQDCFKRVLKFFEEWKV
ncbi:hypothetical protein PIROE2DRAFT_59630 [Piromyces sp. E2]|nr:hypothetical protein PIROE2DRAFT_59630 [Piromyces sp. E2]|eukprot:OUM65977.1 hypothetical protein PIROE2DRAFT_59630 [Piromyces sp. E2]